MWDFLGMIIGCIFKLINFCVVEILLLMCSNLFEFRNGVKEMMLLFLEMGFFLMRYFIFLLNLDFCIFFKI